MLRRRACSGAARGCSTASPRARRSRRKKAADLRRRREGVAKVDDGSGLRGAAPGASLEGRIRSSGATRRGRARAKPWQVSNIRVALRLGFSGSPTASSGARLRVGDGCSPGRKFSSAVASPASCVRRQRTTISLRTAARGALESRSRRRFMLPRAAAARTPRRASHAVGRLDARHTGEARRARPRTLLRPQIPAATRLHDLRWPANDPPGSRRRTRSTRRRGPATARSGATGEAVSFGGDIRRRRTQALPRRATSSSATEMRTRSITRARGVAAPSRRAAGA